MTPKRIASNSGFVALLALLAACHGKPETSADIRPVRTAVVGTGQLGDRLAYTGEIRARHESDLGFQVAGKLIARPAEIGANVTAGTVLAQLDPADEKVAVNSAQSAVSAAQAELARATSEEASYRSLLERGLTTRTAYIEQQTAAKTAQARLQQATAELDLRRRQLNYTTLRAGSAGVITRVSADVGAVLAQGQAVVTLAQPSELDVVFDVADTQVDTVRNAKSVSAALLSARDKPLVAYVREVSPSADPVTRTYRVKCTLPGQPPGWRLGLNTIVTLASGNAAHRSEEHTSELQSLTDLYTLSLHDALPIYTIRNAKSVSAALLSARDNPLVAYVREVSPSADPVTRTYRVKCTLPGQPPGWRLGLNTIVTLASGNAAH